MQNKFKNFIVYFISKYGFIYSKVHYIISYIIFYKLHKKKLSLYKAALTGKKNDKFKIILKDINEKGYSKCKLSEIFSKHNELLEFLKAKVEINKSRKKNTNKSFFHNLYDLQVTENNDVFVEFSTSKQILEICSNYLKSIPILSGIQIIKSEKSEKKFSSMNWHFDSHHNKLLKIMILIHDVSEKNGPTTFLDKNSTELLIKKNFLFRCPKYFQDSELKHYMFDLDQRILKFTGKAGDVLIIDTSKCFHMGSRCETERYQSIITYNPVLTNDLDTLKLDQNKKDINKLIDSNIFQNF